MRAFIHPLAIVLLTGCRPGGPAPLDDDSALTRLMGARWQVESRAFSDRGGRLGAPLPGVGLELTATDGGLQVHDGTDERLRIRTARWGRADERREAGLGQPTLGRCVTSERANGRCVQRMERPGEGITEWWVALQTGVEQGWTVDAPPAGDGPLAIEVALDGAASIAVTTGGATVMDAEGQTWRVGEVVAVDDRGTTLPAWLEPAPQGLLVRVDDAGAAFPLQIDPVYTTAASTFDGEARADFFGFSVSGAGDVNGDGYDDFIVGAPRSTAGSAYLFHGSSSGLPTTASTSLTGDAGGDHLGSSVSSVGDVNGDGYDDVAVGAPGYRSSRGRVQIHHGSSSGLSTTASTTLEGDGPDHNFGQTVAGAGDVNGDGYDDLVVSSLGDDVLVYFGGASGVSTTADLSIPVVEGGSGSASDVVGVGDVNGDGYDDIAIGHSLYDSGTGRVHIVLGASTGPSSTADMTIAGEASGSYFGYSISKATDVDGDGYDDLVVGAYAYGSGAGRVYVFPGSPSGVSSTATTTLDGETTDCTFGSSVSGAGDVDGDGFDDVIVGARGNYYDRGRAYLYHGTATGLEVTASPALTGEDAENEFGFSVAVIGDVDGDGLDEVAVGARGHAAYRGRAYVYHGFVESDEDGDGITNLTDCDDFDASVGGPVTRYLDADGDGYGSTQAEEVCRSVPGYSDVDTDCDDADPAIHPGAQEVCDPRGVDEDCDGLVDEDDDSAVGTTILYRDGDGDTWGSVESGAFCDRPTGYVLRTGDCDDANDAVHPRAEELCNGVDDDCDGAIDLDAVDTVSWYADADGDGYTDPEVQTVACAPPAGYLAASAEPDCDDTDTAVSPGAMEVCDAEGVDEDCDGLINDDDPSCTGKTNYYLDNDGDGYGIKVMGAFCEMPPGYSTKSGDCDDQDPSLSPVAEELPGDGIDQDCDGQDADAVDEAGDGGEPGEASADKGGCGCATRPDDGFAATWIVGALLVPFLARRRRPAP